MTEIKLTKRYPQSRTEDIVDAYMRGWNDALDAVQNGKFIINDDRKTEPSNSEKPNNCEHITEDGVTCAKYPACDDCLDNPLNKVKGSERLLKGKDEPTISKMEQVEDEPQTQLTAKCLNCNNAKACKEHHWEGCVYEPKDEKTCETCRHWKYIAHEWQCEACKCQGYEPKDEPQTDLLVKTPRKSRESHEKAKDEPQTYCGDFADRLAYERGVKHAWEVAQKVFDSTVTFYEAEDVAKQIDKDINVRCKDEPKICDTCRYYNSNIPCGSTPSACKEADKFAEEFVDGLKKLKPKDEPQRDCFLCKWLGDVDVCGRCRNRNLFAEADTEPKPKDEPQTERSE